MSRPVTKYDVTDKLY